MPRCTIDGLPANLGDLLLLAPACNARREQTGAMVYQTPRVWAFSARSATYADGFQLRWGPRVGHPDAVFGEGEGASNSTAHRRRCGTMCHVIDTIVL